jgi:hypothetical protein
MLVLAQMKLSTTDTGNFQDSLGSIPINLVCVACKKRDNPMIVAGVLKLNFGGDSTILSICQEISLRLLVSYGVHAFQCGSDADASDFPECLTNISIIHCQRGHNCVNKSCCSVVRVRVKNPACRYVLENKGIETDVYQHPLLMSANFD